MKFYPLKLEAVLKEIFWGGKRISEKYSKGERGQSIAEAWTLTNRADDVCKIENGEFAGIGLDEYIEKNGWESVCGRNFDNFPLLVKLIDARNSLSVQVHPDDEYAHSHGIDAGKNEMWYIVEALPGATLVCGLNKDVEYDKDEFKKAAADGKLEKYLRSVEVKKGDVIFIPAGLVHAIGEGILIAEIQQNSNTTYRIYDYNRVGADGKKRELHIDAALEVINPDLFVEFDSVSKDSSKYALLAECEYFSTHKLVLSENDSHSFDGGKMIHLLCVEGNAAIEYDGEIFEIAMGDSYLIPAAMGGFEIFSGNGAEIITASC